MRGTFLFVCTAMLCVASALADGLPVSDFTIEAFLGKQIGGGTLEEGAK